MYRIHLFCTVLHWLTWINDAVHFPRHKTLSTWKSPTQTGSNSCCNNHCISTSSSFPIPAKRKKSQMFKFASFKIWKMNHVRNHSFLCRCKSAWNLIYLHTVKQVACAVFFSPFMISRPQYCWYSSEPKVEREREKRPMPVVAVSVCFFVNLDRSTNIQNNKWFNWKKRQYFHFLNQLTTSSRIQVSNDVDDNGSVRVPQNARGCHKRFSMRTKASLAKWKFIRNKARSKGA